jgi:hypothetical protein
MNTAINIFSTLYDENVVMLLEIMVERSCDVALHALVSGSA